MAKEETIELRWLFAVLRRWWWLILGLTLLAAVLTFVIMGNRPPVYSASATLLIDRGQAVVSGDYNDVRASQQLAETYSQMLTGSPVLEATIAQLGLGESSRALAKRVKVALVPDTQLIELTVTGSDPAEAALIANTIPELFVTRIQALQAERYADTIATMQARMEELPQLIEETQSSLDTLSAKKIEREAKLARLESLLEQYRNDYRLLNQEHEALRLEIARSMASVSIVEAAPLSENPTGSPQSASVTLMVGSDSKDNLGNQPLLNTYSQMLTGRSVLEATIAQLELEETPDELAARVRPQPVPDTQLITLLVDDPEPNRAASIANTIAEVFVAQVQALEAEQYSAVLSSTQEKLAEVSALMENTQAAIDTLEVTKVQEETEVARLESLLAGYRDEYRGLQDDQQGLSLTVTQLTNNIQVIEAAQIPAKPTKSLTLIYTLIAAVVGATLAAGLAFLVEHLDDTVKTPEDVRQMLGLDTLGAISLMTRGEAELMALAKPHSPFVEAFRVLSTNLRFASIDKPLRIVLVTSPGPQEGKSLTVANLAIATAQSGLDVVAVDADLRRPRLHKLFGLDPHEGLTDSVLAGDANGRPHPVGVQKLRVLTSGRALPANPVEFVGSQKMRELLAELTQEVDMVLVDSPPVLPVADAALLARAVDGVLLVVRAGRTRRQAAEQAVEQLRQVGVDPLGVVLNAIPAGKSGYYDYYHTNGAKSTRRQRNLKQRLASLPKLLWRTADHGPESHRR